MEPRLPQNQVALLEEFLSSQEDEFKQSLLKLVESKSPISPIKSQQQALQETKYNIDANLEKMKEDIINGYNLYLSHIQNFEKDEFFKIIEKLNDLTISYIQKKPRPEILTVDELELLENIAKREIESKNYADASCMFRFIIQLYPVYSLAWVGWAISEYELKNLALVDQIYEMALAVMPNDLFIPLYAAQFYMLSNSPEKARLILQKAHKECLDSGLKDSETFKEIMRLLATV